MRICIYETSHHETALAMLLLLEPEHAECTVFTTEAVASNLRAAFGANGPAIHWMIRGAEEPSRTFIKRLGRFCREEDTDVLLLETVEANHYPIAKAISRLRRTRVVLTVHDVHSNFNSRPRPSIRGIVRHFGKKALLARVHGFIALSSKVARHLEYFVKDKRPVTWVPGAVFVPESFVPITLAPHEPLRLVVPGSYDRRRRDYDKVFRFAREWEDQGLDIRIVLLGGDGPDRESILARCKDWEGNHVQITRFGTGELPEPEFTRHMQSAHFIWVPSVIRTIIADGIEEVYGLSKSSGNLFDAIRYARPLIIPADLPVDDLQEQACLRYGSLSSLTDLLRSMTAERYATCMQEALAMAENHTVASIRARTPGIREWAKDS